jgi:hypothetical protein
MPPLLECLHVGQTPHFGDEVFEQRGPIVPSPRESQLQRHVQIDHGYTVEFARVLHGGSPNAAFSFLSGNGADQTGRSRIAFARYKGEA